MLTARPCSFEHQTAFAAGILGRSKKGLTWHRGQTAVLPGVPSPNGLVGLCRALSLGRPAGAEGAVPGGSLCGFKKCEFLLQILLDCILCELMYTL